MQRKKAGKKSAVIVVPNPKSLSMVAGAAKRSKARSAKADYALISRAYQANSLSKTYKLVKNDDHATVVIHDKDTGRLLSKFNVDTKTKKAVLSKPALKPRAGTIPIKKILDVI